MAVRRGVAVGGDRDLLPAAARRARRPPGARDAVAHAGARATSSRRRARSSASSPFLRELRPRVARARRRRRPRIPGWRASSSARPGCYAAAAERFEARGGDLLGGVRAARRPGPRRPPTRCCRCWPPTPACGSSSATGHRRRTASASAHWGGGFWLPECAHAPWLDPLLEEAGVHATCVDLHRRAAARVAGPPAAAAQRRRAAARADRPRADRPRLARTTATRRHGAYRDTPPLHRAPPHALGGRRRALRPGARRRPGRARTRATSSRAAARRLQDGGLAVCALDTELLGHCWHEGVDWLAATIEACAARASSCVPLDAALADVEPAALAPSCRRRAGASRATSRRGARPRPPSWPGAQRAAELRVLGAERAVPAARAARAAGAAGLRLGVPASRARPPAPYSARAGRRARRRLERGMADPAGSLAELRNLAPSSRPVDPLTSGSGIWTQIWPHFAESTCL